MIQTLYYEIAGHGVAIETPDADAARRFMPGYEPFLLGRDAIGGACPEPVLHFALGKEIAVPAVPAVDDMENEGIRFRVYVTDGFVFATSEKNGVLHVMKATRDWSKVETDISLAGGPELISFKAFITTAFGMAAAPYKTVKMHASCIEKNGEALLFMGVSGTGKSTHSRLWREFVPGCSLLNDDEPIVRIADDGSVRVYGAPWSGSTPCYRNVSARVAAFVHLHQSSENKLTRLSGLQAISSMMLSAAVFRSNIQHKNRVFDTLSDALNTTPVYRLDCLPNRDAVRLTESLLSPGGRE
ncbi:MAG: hypothetical protein Q4G48_10360 [Bacteroidia bacterium]|nr:hypothetical protein [Bacteroidia bacterium]